MNVQMLWYSREFDYVAVTPKEETEMIGTLSHILGSHGKLWWSGTPERNLSPLVVSS